MICYRAASCSPKKFTKIPLPMKTTVTTPVLVTRSLLTLTFGCALACLPLGNVSAQGDTGAPAPAVPDAQTTPAATTSAESAGATAPSGTAKLSKKEMEFVKKAGAGNEAEVKAGKLAQTNAESQEVKDFAAKMVTDHGDANTDLEAVAKSGNVPFPPAEMEKQKMQYEKLSKLQGAAFDKAYVKDMVADHEKDLADYKAEKAEAKDPELKAYTDKTEKVVAEHLKMIKEIESKMMKK